MSKSSLIAAVLALGPVALAEDSAPIPTPDLAKGAIDPYDAGVQRSKFRRAAGVDSELSADELAADAKNSEGFARSFDKWENLVKFDKNKNGTLDWFEASSYREDLRARFLAEYDTDKNGKLSGPERERANQALAAGRLPRALPLLARGNAPAAPGAPAAPENPPDSGPGRIGGRGGFGGPGGFGGGLFDNDPEYQKSYEQIVQKYDKDGDGRLSREEREAAREETDQLNHQAFMKKYDADSDGKVSKDEWARSRRDMEARMEEMGKRIAEQRGVVLDDATKARVEQFRAQMKQRGDEMQERMFKYDTDGDGKLNDAEMKAFREDQRKEGEQRRQEFIKQFDKNGDGQLDDEERRAMFESFRQRGLNGGNVQ